MAGETTSQYTQLLTQLLDQFKPGGEIEQQRFAEAEREGQMLRGQLAGTAIQKGLGNVALGIPTQVGEQVTRAKRAISSDISGQYMGILSNLMQLSFQAEQAELNRGLRREEISASRTSTQAADKQAERQLEAEEWQAALERDRARIEGIEARRAGTAKEQVSAATMPGLYRAGGYGEDSVYSGEPLLSPDKLAWMGIQPAQEAQGPEAPKVSQGGFGPMFQDQTVLDVTKTRHSDESLWR